MVKSTFFMLSASFLLAEVTPGYKGALNHIIWGLRKGQW
jgi:hypothetical protein